MSFLVNILVLDCTKTTVQKQVAISMHYILPSAVNGLLGSLEAKVTMSLGIGTRCPFAGTKSYQYEESSTMATHVISI